MAENKKGQQQEKKEGKDSTVNPMTDKASNTANVKGAVDLGKDGTKATASQQQGQGAWNANDKENKKDK